MGFHEVQFPTDISYGSQGGPGFDTAIIEIDTGAEERVSRRSSPRYSYNVAYGVKTFAQLVTLRDFYNARKGAAYGFRYKDWFDFSSASDGVSTPDDEDQTIGTGDGTTTTFQLIKTYTSGSESTVRTIQKPVANSVVVALDGVAQASGWTVNTTTGVITFTSAPGSSVVVSAGYEFDVPVRFGEDIDEGLIASYDDFSTGSVPDISLMELLDERAISDQFYYGGGIDHGVLDADTSITVAQGRVHRFAPTSSGFKVIMPDFTDLALGGPYFVIVNDGSASLDIEDHLSAGIYSGLNAGAVLVLYLTLDSGGSKEWIGVGT